MLSAEYFLFLACNGARLEPPAMPATFALRTGSGLTASVLFYYCCLPFDDLFHLDVKLWIDEANVPRASEATFGF